MHGINIVLAIGMFLATATAADAQCRGPNCQGAQYVPTIKLAPWNYGSRIIRLRRVRPTVQLRQYQPQQQAPPVQQGQWRWQPGVTQQNFVPYVRIPQSEYDQLRQQQAPRIQ